MQSIEKVGDSAVFNGGIRLQPAISPTRLLKGETVTLGGPFAAMRTSIEIRNSVSRVVSAAEDRAIENRQGSTIEDHPVTGEASPNNRRRVAARFVSARRRLSHEQREIQNRITEKPV